MEIENQKNKPKNLDPSNTRDREEDNTDVQILNVEIVIILTLHTPEITGGQQQGN